MAGKNGSHPMPSRPPLSTHQSNSVPSTPHQHARDFRSRSRSPSPHVGLGLGSHSPRSVKSEANHGPMTTLPKGRPTCKYETSAAYTRRRMQYDIGDAPLEKPKQEPKKALDPHEEKKLSGDMRELYDRLFPTNESNERRMLFVKKLNDILRKEWPETEFKVHIFGSHANNLCTSESDVDICIETPMKKLESMHMLAEALANNGMERVICIAAAKVPIVKIWDPVLKVAADMNVNNTLALENTRMIRTYVLIDDRVRPLGLMIKHWSKQRILNDAGIGGTLSSYAWTCMILNFLQTRNPPILPALHQLPHAKYIANDGSESGFSDDLDSLKDFGAGNKETIGELLFHFFRHYAHEVNYETSVVSVRHGKLLSRKEKEWDGASKDGQWRLCIEEPFNSTRNLGNSADSTAFRGIHLELRRAFDLLVDGGQLEKVCEEYQFPPEEKGIFKKPVSGPKPILSAIPSQPQRSGRSGSNARNNRHNNGQKNGASYGRRSSSGASFGRSQNPPFVQSPPLGALGSDYLSAVSIQEQLFQQSQAYGIQIEQLKAKMFFQQSQIQMQEQARSVANAHAQSVIHGSNQSSRDASATVSPQKTPYITGNSSPQVAHHPEYYAHYLYPHGYDIQGIAQPPPSQDGSSRTNPSSPSLSTSSLSTTTTIPARRTAQRSSLASDGQSSSARSQSQPPRALAHQAVHHPWAQFLQSQGVQYYAIPSYAQDQQRPQPQPTPEMPGGFDLLSRTTSLPVKDGSPKEYVGYYMHEPKHAHSNPPPAQAQPPPISSYGNIPPIPQYSELAQRRNRPSEELQLGLNGVSRISRSPSPLGLGHHRTISTPLRGASLPLRSAPLPTVPKEKEVRHDFPQQPYEPPAAAPCGLLIVNGSSYPLSSLDNRSDPSEEDFSIDDSSSAYTAREEPFKSDDLHSSGIPQQPTFEIPALGQRYSPPTRQPTGSDGFLNNAGNFESDGGSNVSPSIPFPPFNDPGYEDDTVVSPKSTQQSPWRNPPTSKPSVPHIDTSTGQDQPKQSEPKTAPLLSPVYETRTPSPTAHRRSEHIRGPSLNGIIPPIQAKENGTVNGRPHRSRSGAAPPTPIAKYNANTSHPGDKHGKTSSTPTSTATSSTTAWQTSGKKKNKQRTHSKVGSGSSNNGNNNKRGEPMPANESERKGG